MSNEIPIITLELLAVNPSIGVEVRAENPKFDIELGSIKPDIAVILCSGEAVDLVHPDYEGPYVVTPAVNVQTLDSRGKAMSEDVTVLEIPIYEVSNEYGTTINIGG